MMNNLLIKLKPLTPFFFGSEQTFGEKEKNYFAKSNFYPQQTTLLGLVRHQILVQNQNMQYLGSTESLIGPKSFSIDEISFNKWEFGRINSISPLFLSDGVDYFFPEAFDYSIINNSSNNNSLSLLKLKPVEGNSNNIQLEYSADKKSYNPKIGLSHLWVNSKAEKRIAIEYDENDTNTKSLIYEPGIFIPRTQAGIHRELTKKKNTKDESGYYLQKYFNLRDNFHFAFFLNMNTQDIEFKTAFVSMGGERSMFKMIVEPLADQNINFDSYCQRSTYGSHRGREAIVFVSDGLCKENILESCDFSINESSYFRYISTNSSKMDYTRLNTKENPETTAALSKSRNLFNLIRRGSIFYPKDLKQFINYFDNQYLKNAGFNHFKIL